MSARILYIAHNGLADQLGQSQILPYVRELARLGYEMDLLSLEKPDRLAQEREKIEAAIADFPIRWTPTPFHSTPPVLAKVKDLAGLKKQARRLMHEREFGIVHGRSYVSSWVALDLKRRAGAKFIFDMDGFWVDERRESGIWNLRNPAYRLMYHRARSWEHQMLAEADHIVSLTYRAKEIVAESPHVRERQTPITVVPCSADLAHFQFAPLPAEERAAGRAELGLAPEDFVLTYLGSLGTWNRLEEMIAFYGRVLVHKPETKFLIITGEPSSMIEAAAQRQGVPTGGIVIRKVPYAEVPPLLRLADAGLFLVQSCFSRQASSPTKQGEMMAMGLPVIANDGVGDTAQVVRDYKVGLVVEAFTAEAYDAVAARLDELLAIDPAHVRRAAEDFYALDEATRRYDAVYARLLGRAPLHPQNAAQNAGAVQMTG